MQIHKHPTKNLWKVHLPERLMAFGRANAEVREWCNINCKKHSFFRWEHLSDEVSPPTIREQTIRRLTGMPAYHLKHGLMICFTCERDAVLFKLFFV